MKRLRHRVRACVRRLPESSNPWVYLNLSVRAAICAVYLCEGYHENSNYIRTITEVSLAPKEIKFIICSICTHLTTAHQTSVSGTTRYVAATDSSVEESAHLNETSRFVLSWRLILQVSSFADSSLRSDSPTAEMLTPLYKDMGVGRCYHWMSRKCVLTTAYQVNHL